MCDRSLSLRALVNERLTAAAEEIFALVERTIVEYEEELCRSKEENQRKQQLLDSVLNRHTTQGVQMDFSPESSVKQEIQETPQIKKEPEEQSSKNDTANIVVTDVFSLHDGNNKTSDKAFSYPVYKKDSNTQLHPKTTLSKTVNNSSQLQQRPTRKDLHSQTEEQTDNSSETDNDEDWEPAARSSTAQMETEADGDHYNQVQIKDTSTDAHTSGLFSKYRCGAESRATVTEGHVSGTGGGGGDKKYECSVCQKRFMTYLRRHIRIHRGERTYTCLICKKTFTQKGSLNMHMRWQHGERL